MTYLSSFLHKNEEFTSVYQRILKFHHQKINNHYDSRASTWLNKIDLP